MRLVLTMDMLHLTLSHAGPDRTIYLLEGLLAKNEIPEYLTGEVPGDYGCYPLGLSMKSEDFDKLEVCCWKVTLSNISELLFPSIWQPQ
nr:chlorophyll a-b binding protein CP26, chloroplastic-like isoform X2 [Physcomitrium patens]|eukprot:XP_024374443.1 chlorophyll a-b binding protein CP26, chloroplastic-like isoform X2 [Physcomitrella patens]